MFISAGNSGPGINTIGDPSVASKVMSVGAYVSREVDAADGRNWESETWALGLSNAFKVTKRDTVIASFEAAFSTFERRLPVKRDDGSTAGLLVTGWTYRRFAYHLQESLKRELQEQQLRGGDTGKLPVIYVLLFDREAVYGPRGIPVVNEKILMDLDLVGKTAAGNASGVLEITERAFGWAAARLPRLGEDIGVVVLRSEI